MDKNKLLRFMSETVQDTFLLRTSSIESLSKEGVLLDDSSKESVLKYMYESKSSVLVHVSSVINAIFTQRLQTFMLNRDTCIKLIKEDTNSNVSMSNGQYKRLLHYIANSGVFEVLREHSNKKAGVYKLIQKDFVDELSRLAAKDYFEAQEKYVLSIYDDTKQTKSKTTAVKTPGKSKIVEAVIQDLKSRGLKYDPTRE